MNKKLLALLVSSGVVIIGGLQYFLATPRPGVTRQDLIDAGITSDCDPVEVSCQGRDLCQSTRPDGGLTPRYRTVRALAWRCDHAGAPVLITRWPRQAGRDCFEPIGPPDTACQVNGPSFDDGGQPSIAADVDRCACRARGQICRVTATDADGVPVTDGGTKLAPFDTTLFPPFAGAGCVPKSCSEAAGEQGQSMPTECR